MREEMSATMFRMTRADVIEKQIEIIAIPDMSSTDITPSEMKLNGQIASVRGTPAQMKKQPHRTQETYRRTKNVIVRTFWNVLISNSSPPISDPEEIDRPHSS